MSGRNTERIKLESYLLRSGKVTPEQLAEARERQRGAKRPLQDVLVEMGFVDEQDIFNWLKMFTGIPVVELADSEVDEKAAKLVPYKFAVSNGVIPFRIEGDQLYVAMSNPLDVNVRDELRRLTGFEVKPFLALPSSIQKAIERVHEVDDTIYDVLKNIMVDDEGISFVSDENEQAGDDAELAVEDTGSCNPIVRLVNLILAEAVKVRASDLHIEPCRQIAFVKYRVDGMLRTVMKLPTVLMPRITARIKIMAKLDIAEKRVPQDGRAFIAARGRKFDLRVSTLPTIYGEKTVIRILDKSSNVIGLENLNLLPKERERLEAIITKPYGMFLVVGPTGSGKSTTLYSILQRVNREDNNVITVEDPVEYNLKGVNQVQVNYKAGLTFAKAIRSILRQDPDVVMVGEIRDAETAEISVRASMTGHLVMSTAHTNDAPSAVTRLLDIGVDKFLIASSLLGVIAQRLLRRLCPHCKETYRPDERLLAKIASQLPFKDGQEFYRAVGCEHCDFTGYKGRLAVFEIMLVDPTIREMILDGENDRAIMYYAVKAGMDTLFMSGLRRVYAGDTSLDELLRVVEMQDMDILLCPECGSPVEEDFHFCVHCGHKLSFHCPNCGEPVKSAWRFCRKCGADLGRSFPLPAEAGARAAEPSPEETVERPLLLIVDDDKSIRRMIKIALRKSFKTIVEADNGLDGLRFARQLRPDMMVLDVMMPGMTGFEVCKKLRSSLETSQVPVILLTALSEEEGQQEGIDVGADDYITKPFSPARLKARVELLMKRRMRLMAPAGGVSA